MTAPLAEPLLGVQSPRLSWMPVGDWDYSLADQCVGWARDTLRIHLDPWECLELRKMLARRPDGRWVCPEYVLILSRRNGKSLVLLVRCLFGLIVLGDSDTQITAHLGKTIPSTWRLCRKVLDKSALPILDKGLRYHAYASDGRERLEFGDSKVLWFSTRTKDGGRGEGGDTLVVDEAQKADDDEMDALTPILGDRSISGNPQLLFAGSAGNFGSTVLAKLRRRGIAGGDPRLGFSEYSIDEDAYLDADPVKRDAMIRSVASMAQANPSLGIMRVDGSGGLGVDWLQGQINILSPQGFAREHLGIGTWPADDSSDWIIPRLRWAACADRESPPLASEVALAIGAAWDRTVSIGVCGLRADGSVLAELTHYGADSSVRIVKEVVRLRDEHRPCVIVVDDKGPADFLIAPLEAAGVVLEHLSVRDVAAATSGLHAAVTEQGSTFRHRDQAEVSAALAGAKKKDLGDGWVLDRRRSSSDVTPLEVIALARWGFVKFGAAEYDLLKSFY